VSRRPRVLVLTASVGAGHDVPARHLADGIRTRGGEVELADVLAVAGAPMRRAATRVDWTFGVQHLLFARTPALRALGQAALHRVEGPRLLAEIARRRPDVVVSVYPASTELIGRLRRSGRLDVPAVGVITDLTSLRYWAAPGIDLHLVTHPESLPEVAWIAGPGPAFAVRGLYDERFLDPPPRTPGPPVIAVSGGGWGVGDPAGAIVVARRQGEVVALCGHNDRLRDTLAARFPNVRVLGFVDDMVTLLAQTDVLVHSTAGLTILEALLVGCRPLSYGWSVGHVRTNERAFERLGLAEVVRSRDELGPAIARALAAPREPLAPRFAELPHAAELVLELASAPVPA
jgi:UDP-N-acetylglucosamine:LPS N-acetylglucosamine transferase